MKMCKHKVDGYLYAYSDNLAKQTDIEVVEVPDEKPSTTTEKPKKKKTKAQKYATG